MAFCPASMLDLPMSRTLISTLIKTFLYYQSWEWVTKSREALECQECVPGITHLPLVMRAFPSLSPQMTSDDLLLHAIPCGL